MSDSTTAESRRRRCIHYSTEAISEWFLNVSPQFNQAHTLKQQVIGVKCLNILASWSVSWLEDRLPSMPLLHDCVIVPLLSYRILFAFGNALCGE